jgi:hypothetical protein
MAQLTKASFLSTWATNFLDNVARLITESVMRSFRLDVSDSFMSILDNLQSVDTLDTTAAPIAVSFGNIGAGSVVANRIIKGSAPISGAKTWTFSNPTSSRKTTINFEISALPAVQTFPSSVIMMTNAGAWDTSTQQWTPADIGKYQMEITYDDTDHHVKLFGPFY